jgi:hypothetical protein
MIFGPKDDDTYVVEFRSAANRFPNGMPWQWTLTYLRYVAKRDDHTSIQLVGSSFPDWNARSTLRGLSS